MSVELTSLKRDLNLKYNNHLIFLTPLFYIQIVCECHCVLLCVIVYVCVILHVCLSWCVSLCVSLYAIVCMCVIVCVICEPVCVNLYVFVIVRLHVCFLCFLSSVCHCARSVSFYVSVFLCICHFLCVHVRAGAKMRVH